MTNSKTVSLYNKRNPIFGELHNEIEKLMGRNLWARDFMTLWDDKTNLDFFNQVSFPKYNEVKVGNDVRLEIALAGYKREDLAVELSPEKVLTVSSSKLASISDTEEEEDVYLHRGIAGRDFTISWRLSPWAEVGEVAFENGMLNIEIKNKTPEKPKSKLLEIK